MVADFGLSAFRQTALGRKAEAVLTDPENVRDMVALCRNDIPAVRAIGKQLLALGMKPRDDEAKKLVGRWVREIMAGKAWEPLRTGKIPRGNLFSTGTIYRPKKDR
ncbi:MAG: hypothetical protein HY834_18715 [Devosia nanyangense]|uniref:Uncharacterized protein n=1 Tax=Devosia nanyangense TaxID=1228055 RepID=A0A933L649_9HYPH|nr:hypothetical protein [Devosia nanyangense]